MDKTEEVGDDEKLSEEEAAIWRFGLGKLMWISGDRLEIKFAVNQMAGERKEPLRRSWRQLKKASTCWRWGDEGAHRRVKVHLGKHDKFIEHGGWTPDGSSDEKSARLGAKRIHGYVDSDWGTCKITRRSVSGGCIFYMGCMVTSWCRKQTVVALSSAEAELISLNTGIQEVEEVRNMLAEIFDYRAKQK
eukprot:6456126-Amphidinium_carterae.1